ncbi:MAG: CDP-diacylglycerol--serine O-phosphatidyltransferase [Planctomycetota bacterium]
MKKFLCFVPTIATLANLSAGVTAIVLAVYGTPEFGALMVLAAMLCDSFDGALARAFDACSDFGGQLDSLADLVSFGVAPGLLVLASVPESQQLLATIAAISMALCAAMRLARYHVNKGDEDSDAGFEGMPTTAAGGCVASTVLIFGLLVEHGLGVSVLLGPWVVFLFAVLMVSDLKYPHISTIMDRMPTTMAVVIAVSVGLVALFWVHEIVFFAFFVAYALSGPLLTIRDRVKARRHAGIR